VFGDPTLGMPSSTAYDATPRPQPQDESGSLIKLMARRMQISGSRWTWSVPNFFAEAHAGAR